jgi:signal transduction histidine kinase
VQVLSNLIGNSLDALSDEGVMSFCIRRRGSYLCLSVADNGKGIDTANMNRLFEPFFTTKKDEGNGLGLALSKKIVERHGGSIGVRSSTVPSRCGTTFRIRLPLHSEARAT